MFIYVVIKKKYRKKKWIMRYKQEYNIFTEFSFVLFLCLFLSIKQFIICGTLSFWKFIFYSFDA